MINKNFLMGILVIALVFGMMVVGCGDGGDKGKESQAMPTGLGTTDCTTLANNDGTITGVTTAMEYDKLRSEASAYIVCTGTTVTGLSDGIYLVRYKETAKYHASPYVYVTINAFSKSNQAAPTDLGKTDCTTEDNNDGTITGVTTAMEYKQSTALTFTTCTGDTTLTGLSNGTYHVRYAETATHNASPNAIVIIAAWQEYQIGDIGPGGGIIFYYSEEGFTVEGYSWGTISFAAYTAHYLEAASSNHETSIKWTSSDNEYYYPYIGTKTGIGTGKFNTVLILVSENNAPAAKVTQGVIGNKSDWFLPSIDELQELYKLYVAKGGDSYGNLQTTYDYWSSSQSNKYQAWTRSFNPGRSSGVAMTDKGISNYVRAIRAF